MKKTHKNKAANVYMRGVESSLCTSPRRRDMIKPGKEVRERENVLRKKKELEGEVEETKVVTALLPGCSRWPSGGSSPRLHMRLATRSLNRFSLRVGKRQE